MATATSVTVAPEQETKKAPLNLTPQAIAKVREIMATQDPLPAGMRIGVVGGGCSGFQYSTAAVRPSTFNLNVETGPSDYRQFAEKARPLRGAGPFGVFVILGMLCPIVQEVQCRFRGSLTAASASGMASATGMAVLPASRPGAAG